MLAQSHAQTEEHGITLGPLRLDSRAVLAPLAGYTDSPMRRICRRYGAGLVFSEMLSGEGARRRSEKTFRMAAFHPEERPYFVQFFATNPLQAADAVRILGTLEPDGFDLNFGCPVRKIIQGSGGAALLKDIPLLKDIVAAAVEASAVPVSVKIRAGWDSRSVNAVEVARAAEEAGAVWVTVHARTRSEFYQGHAHWDWIGEVKAAVSIPVIGNGDVRTAEDALRLLQTTRCDAVMIGRAAMGNPFIFREVNELLAHGKPCPPATPGERFAAARQQLLWMAEAWGERKAVLDFRKHLLAYVRGLPRSAAFKAEAMRIEDLSEVLEAMEKYFCTLASEPPRVPCTGASAAPETCR